MKSTIQTLIGLMFLWQEAFDLLYVSGREVKDRLKYIASQVAKHDCNRRLEFYSKSAHAPFRCRSKYVVDFCWTSNLKQCLDTDKNIIWHAFKGNHQHWRRFCSDYTGQGNFNASLPLTMLFCQELLKLLSMLLLHFLDIIVGNWKQCRGQQST